MIDKRPEESKKRSWSYVVIWSLLIFITIPLARFIQSYISQHWGRHIFMYGVIAIIVIILIATLLNLQKNRKTVKATSYLWLVGISAIFITYTIILGKKSPEEAVHFVQYGILTIFIYRALTHDCQDNGIYFASALIATAIGITDEAIQWLTPNRVWGLSDIRLNTIAASLTLLALGLGLKPAIISGTPARATWLIIYRSAIVVILLLGASLLNTPERISWYTNKMPVLNFLKEDSSIMAEYGYQYEDSETGVFRSRLAPEKLKLTDMSRASEAAAVLDRYPERRHYQEFLKYYTPFNAPFLHEARVHLHRRDYHLQTAEKFRSSDLKEFKRRMTIAYYENRIMEKYFPQTLTLSSFVLSPETIRMMKNNVTPGTYYDSPVSGDLITHINEKQVFWVSIILVIIILTIDRRLSAKSQT